MITGYFSARSNGTIRKKFSNLFVIDHLYSALICATLCLVNIQVSTKMIIESAFPIWFGLNWFVTCYMLLLLLIPFLNIFLKNINDERLKNLIIIILFVRYLAGSLFAKTFMNVGNTLEEFITMYLTGSLLSKERCSYGRKKTFHSLLCVGIVGLVLSDSALYLLLNRFESLNQQLQVTHFHDLFNVMIAIGAFGIAINKTIHSKTINTLSRCVLGTYLIHDNPMIREIIWRNSGITQILNKNFNTYIVIIFFYAILIMTVCFIIDGIIRLLLEKPIMTGSLIMEKIISKITRRLSIIKYSSDFNRVT